jgi:hypothetical protein
VLLQHNITLALLLVLFITKLVVWGAHIKFPELPRHIKCMQRWA